MPIYRLLQHQAFEPEVTAVLGKVFEEVLRSLGLADRSDPLTELVARKVIELAQRGERDPVRLQRLIIEEFQQI
jgi:hypothetical protein